MEISGLSYGGQGQASGVGSWGSGDGVGCRVSGVGSFGYGSLGVMGKGCEV